MKSLLKMINWSFRDGAGIVASFQNAAIHKTVVINSIFDTSTTIDYTNHAG